MPVTARKYNPGFLTDDELVASFCVRTVEFEMLVEVLRECTGPSNPHQIVIGPRGSGKTILLLRIAAEVRRDAELSAGFFPVVFPEESYEVATAGEFWLECLSRLAAQAPRREDAPDLHRTFEELRTVRNDRELADRCLGALLDFSDREGKRLVLVVENLNMLFRDMADADAGWRLRKVLQTEPRIVLLASATSRFDEIDDPKHALYDLFSVRTLRPLDTSECATLWEAVAGRRPPPGTIRSLEILTGGSPRLITIVARFGAELSFRKLMANLLDLIDDHTEYFKSHLESLPAQERRVYLALAALWKPATTREISDQARMETSKCSAQLTRLIGRGVVQTAGGSARRKQYYLTQRLYNIYYLLRRSRTSNRLVEALIHFMESYYSPSELKDIGARIIRDAEGFGAEMKSLSQAALSQLMELPAMVGSRGELLAIIPEVLAESLDRGSMSPSVTKSASVGVQPSHRKSLLHGDSDEREKLASRALFDSAVTLMDRNQVEEALATCDEVVRRFGESDAPGILESVARALAYKGLTLSELSRLDEALDTCDGSVHRFGDSETPSILAQVAVAILVRGIALDGLNRTEDALAAYDEAVHRLGESETPAILGLVPVALVNKGLALGRMNRQQEELSAYDQVVRRFGGSKTPAIIDQVAKALFHKGLTLNGLNRPEEALAAYDDVIRRFGASETPAVVELVAKALFFKGAILDGLNRLDEALAAYDNAVRRFEKSETLDAVELVGKALFLKGLTLDELNRPEEALAAYDEVVCRFGDSETSAVLDPVAKALFHKGLTLGVLNRPEEALAAYDEVVCRFGDSETSTVLDPVAKALFHKGLTLGVLNRSEDALIACDEMVRRFGDSTSPAVLGPIAKALFFKGLILGVLKQPEEALAVWEELVRRYGEHETPADFDPISMAIVSKGLILRGLRRTQDALDAFDEVVQRFAESESPAVRVPTDVALLGKADLELELRRYEAATETAGRALEPRRTESPENRLRGHLIRAKATLAIGDQSACERDVKAALALLPEINPLPRESLNALMFLGVVLWPERMCELIKSSPSANVLLPLTTALELHLGLKPRVAREVEEVAQDIRRDLAKFRETGSYEVS